MANCDSNKNVNKTFIIEPLELTAGTPTLTACTGVYTSKIIACSGDTSIEIYSGLTLNGYTLVNDTLSAVTIDASTIMSGGTNILEIVEASDTFVTGATYDTNNGILTISRNDGVDLTPSGFTSVISHTLPSGSTKTIAQNDMYLIWDDFTINSGSTLDNNGRLVVVNGDFNNFGSYNGSGSLELITTNLEYILNHGNETNGNLIFYTNSPSGWVSGDTISDISAATGNVLVTKEWVELATSVDNNDFTTGATLVDETIVFDRKDTLSAYTVDIGSVNSGDTFVTGGTFSDVGDSLSLVRNDGANVVITGITNFFTTGGTYNNDTNLITFDRNDQLSAFTVNLSTIDVNDTFSTGGTYNDIADTITITRNDGDSFVISGITDYYTTGATLIGNIVYFDREDSLSAYTADLSSLDVNDTFVSGFTRSGNVLTIERNDGVDLPLDISDIVFSGGSGNCITDLYVTNINGCSPINVKDDLVIETKIVFSGTPLLDNTLTQLLVRDSSSGEIKYREANSVDTFVTGATFLNNQLSIDLNNGTNVSALINNLSGLTVDGNVLVNGDVNIIGTATTINSEQVLIKDNIITLNSNVTGSTTPVLNSGFEVLRGSGDTKSILWLENTDLWSIDDDLSVSGYVSGTTYYGDGSNLTGIDDTFVTGGTYSGSTIILNRNDGNSVDVTGITSSNIYTADGTVSDAERVVTLTGNKRITYLGGRVKIDVVASSGTFEFNKNSTKFLEINGNIDLFRSNFKRFENSANQNFFLDIANTTTVCDAQWYSTGTARTHTIRTGSSQRAHFNENGSGTFIVGNNSVVGTEDISLQGETLISKRLELSTTTDGFLMPRLTTAQMNAISSPDTHLLIFNTDLNALYRYNGSAWVAMAAGYGIVSTVDSSGNPTFYTTVKAAYDAGSGSIKLHTDYEETTSNPINIVDGRNIDLNGFTYTYNVADGTSIFEDTTQNNSITITNGKLIRKNGTGGDYIIDCNLTQTRMDVLNVYAENENGACLNVRTTLNGSGSEFVSNNTSSNGFYFNTGSIISFGKYINNNNGDTTFSGSKVKFSEFICIGSGKNYFNGNIYNSSFIANSGRALLTGSNTKIYDCYLESVSSNGLDIRNNSEIYNSTIISDGTVCVNTVGATATKMKGCVVKGSHSVYSVNALSIVEDCIIVNSGTGQGINVNATVEIVNNIIRLEGGTSNGITVNTYVNSLVSGNKIFVNDPSATGIVSTNVDIYIVDNKIKGTTLGVNLGTGTNLWVATTDAQGNSVQL